MENELSAIAAQADALDGELDATGPGALAAQQEEAQHDIVQEQNAGQVAFILDLAVPLIGKMYPSLLDIYDEPTKAGIAASLGPVLTKYGVNLQDLGGRYKEELTAVLIIGPVAWATVEAVKMDIANRAETKAKKAVRVPVATMAEHVTLG